MTTTEESKSEKRILKAAEKCEKAAKKTVRATIKKDGKEKKEKKKTDIKKKGSKALLVVKKPRKPRTLSKELEQRYNAENPCYGEIIVRELEIIKSLLAPSQFPPLEVKNGES